MLHIFDTYVASVLSGCCLCFTWFSSVFHVFLQVFHMHVLSVSSVSSVSSVFRRILQMLHLDVSKVDRVFVTPSNLHGFKIGENDLIMHFVSI